MVNVCKEVLTYWPDKEERDHEYVDQASGMFGFFRGVAQFCVLLGLLAFLRMQANKAELGHLTATETRGTLIFPLYVKILWILAAACLLTSAADMFQPFSEDYRDLASVVFGVAWGLYHFVLEGVAILFTFKGVGGRASRITFVIAGTWAVATAVLHFFMMRYPDNHTARIGELFWDLTLVVFFASLAFLPATVLYRRPSAYSYCKFWTFSRTVQFIGDILIYPTLDISAGHCFNIMSGSGFLSIFAPYIVYRALLHDCWYWQGTLTTSTNESSVRDPLDGISLEPDAARAIAAELGNNPSSSPVVERLMRRRRDVNAGGVHVVNFAELVIDYHGQESTDKRKKKKPAHRRPVILGQGGSAKVYKGRWKDIPVAIKMIWFTELTPADIRRFHTEALLLSQMRHRNVVEVYGVCVHPPSLCLVMELCSGGSLRELLDRSTFPDPKQPEDPERGKSERMDGKTPLTLEQRLNLARQCVDAVSFLHSQKPPVLHLDLKCSNFLIDDEGVVKISDLELSREIVRVSDDKKKNMARKRAKRRRWGFRSPQTERLLDSDDESDESDEEEDDWSSYSLWFTSGAGVGQPETINWLAPEVISQKGCGPPSDVYALGMVIWEILTGKVPFEDDMHITKPKYNPDGSRIMEPLKAKSPTVNQTAVLAQGPRTVAVPRTEETRSTPESSSPPTVFSPSADLQPISAVRKHPLGSYFDSPTEGATGALGDSRDGSGSEEDEEEEKKGSAEAKQDGQVSDDSWEDEDALKSIVTHMRSSSHSTLKDIREIPVYSHETVSGRSRSGTTVSRVRAAFGGLKSSVARARAARKAAEDRRWRTAAGARQPPRSSSQESLSVSELEDGRSHSQSLSLGDPLRGSLINPDSHYQTFYGPEDDDFLESDEEEEAAAWDKDAKLRRRIVRHEYRPKVPEYTPIELRALLLQMWRAEPADRPPASLVAQIVGRVCDDLSARSHAIVPMSISPHTE